MAKKSASSTASSSDNDLMMAMAMQGMNRKKIKAPEPVAPISPTAQSAKEISMANREEKERIRKAFSNSKTVLSRNDTPQQGKQTLG
jgi:hypothetical protein